MAGSFTDYTELEFLDHYVNNGTAPTWATRYVGLSTTTPTDAGGNIDEPTGVGSYARKATTAADWGTAAAGAVSNTSAITFVTATASWGTVTHFVDFDALTDGNALAWADLTASKAIGNGDTAEFAIGDYDITLD